jgi:competence ComEA-like helix-hairpin-helix protein
MVSARDGGKVSARKDRARFTAAAGEMPAVGQGRQVVVFDEDRVVEPHAVVPASPHANRVFVEQTPARHRFSRVVDAAAGAGHGVYKSAGGGGHARHPAEKVEHHPFGREHTAGSPREHGHPGTGLDDGSIGHQRPQLESGIGHAGHDPCGRQPRDHPGPACYDGQLTAGRAVDQPHARPVALVAKILGKPLDGPRRHMAGEMVIPFRLAKVTLLDRHGSSGWAAGYLTVHRLKCRYDELMPRHSLAMEPPDTPAAVVPPRSQPLIAFLVAGSLGVGVAWFVAAGGLAGRLVHHDAPPVSGNSFTVNINTADETELAQLPGLGVTTARRIIDHRREYGPFTSLDGLLDVPGIGQVTLAAMRPYLRPIDVAKTVPHQP